METKRAKVISSPQNDWIGYDIPDKELAIILKTAYRGDTIWEYRAEGAIADQHGYILSKLVDGGGFVVQYRPVHLYFITDDEIKDGDWFMSSFYSYPLHNTQEWRDKQIKMGVDADVSDLKYHKIVATTDPNLTIEEMRDLTPNSPTVTLIHPPRLPQPSKAFIEKYCKVGGIDEVLIELEPLKRVGLYKDVSISDEEIRNKLNINEKFKVNSHNEITIHPIKDSWSREEIKELLSYAQHKRACDHSVFGHHIEPCSCGLEKWIEQNL